jgi:hypothetical protein
VQQSVTITTSSLEPHTHCRYLFLSRNPVVTRFPALACCPPLWPSHIPWSHLVLGPAQEQRLVKRESLLAHASPAHCLSHRVSHCNCTSTTHRNQSVSRHGACASSFLRQATAQTLSITPSPRTATPTATHQLHATHDRCHRPRTFTATRILILPGRTQPRRVVQTYTNRRNG